MAFHEKSNRLTAFDDGENVYYYAYNGLGDRLQQTFNGVTTTYAVDIAGGLTQVLSDGTNTYLYGVNRISQHHDATTEYYLADALGSVRQLTDSGGDVVMARSYDPYGNLVENNAYDGVTTAYGYAGEFTDASGMIYLRARYYSPAQGRFVSKDVWEGNYSQPQSLNGWNYVNNNPVNYRDPSGYIKQGTDSDLAEDIRNELLVKYNVLINKDWGEYAYTYYPDPTSQTLSEVRCGWKEGNWKSSYELDKVKKAIEKISKKMTIAKFRSAFGQVIINRLPLNVTSFAPPGNLNFAGDIILTDYTMNGSDDFFRYTVIHEFGHVWDYNSNNQLSDGLMKALGTKVCNEQSCIWQPMNAIETAPDYDPNCPPGAPDPTHPGKICPMPYSGTYGGGGQVFTRPGGEDWAQSFTAYIYPYFFRKLHGLPSDEVRSRYVRNQIKKLP